MLIAGDGHTNIFGPDVSSLDPRTWYSTKSGKYLMSELSKKSQLLETNIPDGETFTDDDKAWEYFGELNFDVILANPPFAGEMKDKKMLVKYDLAKPALKRAKDKTAKEERDVLFIERIIKMLRPGGRAAIVLPQGKFNNSSLAFIREWILRKARLLAVVGLHGNTFKPHTGTKTSVLFVQKYTEQQLQDIENIQNEVKKSCPDYAKQIGDLLAKYENQTEIAEDAIPEEIYELLLEEFPEPEAVEEASDDASNDAGEENPEAVEAAEDAEEAIEPLTLEERMEAAEDEISKLRSGLLKAKDNLSGLDDEQEALIAKQKAEIEIAQENWTGDKKDFSAFINQTKAEHKQSLKELKDRQKELTKKYRAEIKAYEKAIPFAEEEKLLLTNKGKLQIILKTEDSIEHLRNRFIDAEVAKRLDYPIFMAVSERGGKNNSGDYEYLTNEDGNMVEDAFGNPEIDQDLVNHAVRREDLLTKADEIKDEDLNIAEAFVMFAKEQKLDFWVN